MADILLSRHTPSGDLLEIGEPIAFEPAAVAAANVPKPVGALYGYAEEGAALHAGVDRGAPSTIGICGPSGVGKTEFLVRALLLGREARPEGHVLLPVRNLGAADIIALLCDAVFAIDDPRLRPPTAACIAALSERRLIVGLDDLRSAQDLAVLRSALRRSLLCFTSSEQWVAGDVAWIPLRGLKVPEGVAFVRATAGRKVSNDVATRLVACLEGNPSRILRAVGGELDLENVATACPSPGAFDKLQFSRAQQELSVNDAVAFAAIATLGRAALGTKSPKAALVKRCLVERSSIGWSVPEGLREHIEGLSIDPAALAAAVLEAMPEGGLSDPYAVLDCAAGVPAVISRGGAVAQQLAGVVCHALDRGGLWGLSTALYRRLYAIRESLEEREMRAWVVHQLATRLACAGDVDTARDLFTEALAAEEGDAEATAVTVANLARLPRKVAVEPLADARRSRIEQFAAATTSGPDAVTVKESTAAIEEPRPLSPLTAIVRPMLPRARRDNGKTGSRVVVGATIALAGVTALGLSSVLAPPASSKRPPAPAMTQLTATTKPPNAALKGAAHLVTVGPTATTRHALPRAHATVGRVASRLFRMPTQATPRAISREAKLALAQATPHPSFRAVVAPYDETAAAAARKRSAARVIPAGAPATPSPVRASSHPAPAPYVVVMAPIATPAPSAGPATQSQRFADSLDPAATRSPDARHGRPRHHHHHRSDATVALIGTPAAPSAAPGGEGQRSQPFADVLSLTATPSPKATAQHAAAPKHHGSVGPQPRIMPFTVLPESIARGNVARLCVSASRADTLYVNGLGSFDPQQTNCRTVKPRKTTTYVARATNQAGQSTERALTVVVR